MRDRLRQTVRKYVIILTVGVAYFAFVMLTGIGIPCLFYTVTGLQCPACGISRMLIALVRSDFTAAYSYNQFLFINLPVILLCLIWSDVKYVRTGDRSLGRLNIVLWIEVALALVFGLVRNISCFAL